MGEIVDNEVNKRLKENPEKDITLWISVEPYAYTSDGIRVNISKFIEDDIIMSIEKGLINKVGVNLLKDKSHTKSVANILNLNLKK